VMNSVDGLFDKDELLHRSLRLVASERSSGRLQFSVTVPSDFVSLCGWKKGDVLKASLILGSGIVCLEKEGD